MIPEKSLAAVSTPVLASSSLVVDAVLNSPEEPLPEESAVSFEVVEPVSYTHLRAHET